MIARLLFFTFGQHIENFITLVVAQLLDTCNFDNWMLENDINHLEAENWNPDSFNQYIL